MGVEKAAGIRPAAEPLREALEVIGPTTFMTLLTDGFGARYKRMAGQEYETSRQKGDRVADSVEQSLAAGRLPLDPAQNFRDLYPTRK